MTENNTTNVVAVTHRPAAVDMKSLQAGYAKLTEALRTMGFSSLRKGQKPVITNIMACRDTLCILPTGSGKTATFVIPTLSLNWKTIVFSPLLALMRDQVQSLQRRGLRAGSISSLQTDAENFNIIKDWAQGELQFLYVAPERLHNELFKDAMLKQPADFVVVDEAHCLSAWSDNFRSSYCRIGDYIQEYKPKAVLACTATCPAEVEDDIRRVLGLNNAQKIIYYPRRDNLNLRSFDRAGDKQLIDIIDDIDGPTIVYCSTIRNVEQLASQLGNTLGEEVLVYHGELSPTERRINQDLFMNDKIRIMVATNAFGMGIDKANIRGVIHSDIPGSVEALSQEIGRAGRDGKPSECITLYSDDSFSIQKFFIECQFPSKREICSIMQVLKQRVNSEGIVQITGADLAKYSRVFKRKADASIQILQAHKVLERHKIAEKIAKVRLDTQAPKDDERFAKYWDLVKAGGILKNGFYEFDLNWVADELGINYTTARLYFKRWAEDNVIRYIPPFFGMTTKIIGDVHMIDFNRLDIKANAAFDKLQHVVDYVETPDSAKHAFLENYFDIVATED